MGRGEKKAEASAKKAEHKEIKEEMKEKAEEHKCLYRAERLLSCSNDAKSIKMLNIRKSKVSNAFRGLGDLRQWGSHWKCDLKTHAKYEPQTNI